MVQPIQILLVEDDEVDVEALRRLFDRERFPHHLSVVPDGLAALDLLRGVSGTFRVEQPYFIILDLNMPRMNGHEFMSVLRQDPRLTPSIVFVLTTSNSLVDIQIAYRHHVAGYFLKREVFQAASSFVRFLHGYCTLVEFPQRRVAT